MAGLVPGHDCFLGRRKTWISGMKPRLPLRRQFAHQFVGPVLLNNLFKLRPWNVLR
jgi:hypothetical protein